jgi:diguanylate cyclase (GGDEF)-like protein
MTARPADLSEQQLPSSDCSVANGADIRVLLVEDAQDDAELAVHQLRKSGMPCVYRRVETEQSLRLALSDFRPDLILSDFRLPQFDGQAALRIAREAAPDTPFIFVSGTIGEEHAIESLLHGAADYVLKGNLKRLPSAAKRALERAAASVERRRQEEQIARLTRVLRMLSGINGLIVRIRGRTELLEEACRLAVSIGRYSTAIVMLRQPGTGAVQPIAWAGVDEQTTEKLRISVSEVANRGTGEIARVLKTGSPYVCNAPVDPSATANVSALMVQAGFQSIVALPLLIDKTVVGILMMTAPDAGTVSEEELEMLREVSANLSFALQYLHKDSTVRLLSHFDPHTGLAKRGLFCERLARKLEQSADHHVLGIGVFDVEQLSVINDSFGRHTGDLLLQHVADRLRRHFHNTDLLAQFGGGTFAIVLDALDVEDLPATLSRHLVAVLGQPFELQGRQLPVVVRSGLAIYPANGRDANVLVQKAESALRNARATGQRHQHYSAEQHTAVMARLALEHKLRSALERNQFELHYQPKVGVKTRRIDGVEALIRWRDPDAGLVSPAAFLPVLEATGLMVEVGEWVIRQAAADCQHWQRLGLPPVRVAVNISPSQLRCPDFSQRFLQLAQSSSNARCGLDIEITEGMLLEDSEAEMKKLEVLRAAGVRVAIDDFGTGYSSLGRLSELPIDTLKIDRSFVCRLPHDHSGKTLVGTVIALARAFNMNTVAEGVETLDQLSALWEMGCDQLQGYLMSKPVARDEFAMLLERGNGRLLLPADASTGIGGGVSA